MKFGANQQAQVRAYYRTLARAWGAQHWWPARSRFEVIAGAYLTQNTAWSNVQRALANLRRAGALSPVSIRRLSVSDLERLIRPAGYFRQKAQRLKTFVAFLDSHYGGSLNRLFAQPTPALREQLLALNGVGPETADSILLYAGNHPVFVVDAYTRRLVERHGLLPPKTEYEDIRSLFEKALAQPGITNETGAGTESGDCQRAQVACRGARGVSSGDQVPTSSILPGAAHWPSRISRRTTATARVFNEMHALIVGVGKNYCFKTAPDCQSCPLRGFLP